MDSLILLFDDILISIAFSCATYSLTTILNFRIVCKKFKDICDERPVLYRVSLKEEEFYPYCYNPQVFYRRYNRLCQVGNPEALYRVGIISYFYDQHKDNGLKLLKGASRADFHDAIYIYGVILICLGGKHKPKGFKILSSLLSPLLSKTLESVEKIRFRIDRHIRSNMYGVCSQLKRSYIKDKCGCDGRTSKFVRNNNIWNRYGIDNDMNKSSVCKICLWDEEVKLLFTDFTFRNSFF